MRFLPRHEWIGDPFDFFPWDFGWNASGTDSAHMRGLLAAFDRDESTRSTAEKIRPIWELRVPRKEGEGAVVCPGSDLLRGRTVADMLLSLLDEGIPRRAPGAGPAGVVGAAADVQPALGAGDHIGRRTTRGNNSLIMRPGVNKRNIVVDPATGRIYQAEKKEEEHPSTETPPETLLPNLRGFGYAHVSQQNLAQQLREKLSCASFREELDEMDQLTGEVIVNSVSNKARLHKSFQNFREHRTKSTTSAGMNTTPPRNKRKRFLRPLARHLNGRATCLTITGINVRLEASEIVEALNKLLSESSVEEWTSILTPYLAALYTTELVRCPPHPEKQYSCAGDAAGAVQRLSKAAGDDAGQPWGLGEVVQNDSSAGTTNFGTGDATG